MRKLTSPLNGYATAYGKYLVANIEEWLETPHARSLEKSINLILTSPPFPLNRKKSYGNLTGPSYLKWLKDLSRKFSNLLTEDGSLVIEIGNAWNKGTPTMSTLPMEALLAIKESSDFHLCQEFICHNPARLPTPVQYVNIERSRVKDSWTRIWWLSKNPRPKANNKNILLPYSKAMQDLLKKQSYNSGKRPSEHHVGVKSFLKNNMGSIPASCLTNETLEHFGNLIMASNTQSNGDPYLDWCRNNKVKAHPARMQRALATFFVSFLTNINDLVFDPFGGSNTTGYVAERLRRKWMAVEIDSKNLEPSEKRFTGIL